MTGTAWSLNTGSIDARSLRLVLLASLIPLLLSVVSVSSAVPTVWSPYPGIQFFLLTAGWPRWLAVAVAPIIFVAALVKLPFERSPGHLPHVALLMGILTVLTVVYFGLRLQDGLDHQGAVYSAVMLVANTAALLTFWRAWIRWRRTLTVPRSIVLCLLACGWLFWCAFPYFGEGI
jgi:hypothetical protein